MPKTIYIPTEKELEEMGFELPRGFSCWHINLGTKNRPCSLACKPGVCFTYNAFDIYPENRQQIETLISLFQS